MRKNKISYIMLVVMIVFSQNTLAFSSIQTGLNANLRDVIHIILFGWLFIKTIINRKLIKESLLWLFCVFSGSVLASMLFHKDFDGIYCLLECAIAYMIIQSYDEIDMAEKFEKIMFIVCSVYSIIHIMILVNKSIIYSDLFNWLYKIEVLYDYRPIYGKYDVTLRSYGFFREPGVYQMFIILAIFVILYVNKKMKWKNLIVYIISLLMTHSTTGYICLLLIMIPSIIKLLCKVKKKILIPVLIVLGIVLLPIVSFMLQNVIEKFTATGASSHSWLARKASLVTNIYLWKKNPIFGVGMGTAIRDFAKITKDVFGYQAGIYAVTDETNTIMLYYAAHGLVPGTLFVGSILKLCKKVSKCVGEIAVLFIMFLCLYSGEALNSTLYPYILFFAGYSKTKLLEKRNDECYQ